MIVVKIIELDIDKKSTVSQILKNKILLTQILKMKEDFQKEIRKVSDNDLVYSSMGKRCIHNRDKSWKRTHTILTTTTLQEKIEITVMDIRLIYILSHLYIFDVNLFCFWVFPKISLLLSGVAIDPEMKAIQKSSARKSNLVY